MHGDVPRNAELDFRAMIVKLAKERGACPVDVADVRELKGILTFPPPLLDDNPRAWFQPSSVKEQEWLR